MPGIKKAWIPGRYQGGQCRALPTLEDPHLLQAKITHSLSSVPESLLITAIYSNLESDYTQEV